MPNFDRKLMEQLAAGGLLGGMMQGAMVPTQTDLARIDGMGQPSVSPQAFGGMAPTNTDLERISSGDPDGGSIGYTQGGVPPGTPPIGVPLTQQEYDALQRNPETRDDPRFPSGDMDGAQHTIEQLIDQRMKNNISTPLPSNFDINQIERLINSRPAMDYISSPQATQRDIDAVRSAARVTPGMDGLPLSDSSLAGLNEEAKRTLLRLRSGR